MPLFEQKSAEVLFVWELDQHCVVSFRIGSLNWRVRFAKSAADWAKRLVGQSVPARQSGSTTFINPYGYDDPRAHCWLEAYRGV